MEIILGLIFGILIAAVVSGVIIFIVAKLNIGLSVNSFGWAMLAGLFIGIVTSTVMYFLPGLSGLFGALINLLVSAAVILLAGKTLGGVKVDGYKGALVVAIALALINFVIGMLFVGTTQPPV